MGVGQKREIWTDFQISNGWTQTVVPKKRKLEVFLDDDDVSIGGEEKVTVCTTVSLTGPTTPPRAH
jgi:hypothetical protein